MLPTYSTGTASVAAGGTVVTGTGGLWTGINAKQGDYISINNLPWQLITEVTDSTHLKITPWQSAAQTNQPYVIYQNYVGRVVGVAAAEDVGDMLERLRDQAPLYNVPTSDSVPDPSYGIDGQWAYQFSTGKFWLKTAGAWTLTSPPLTPPFLPLTGGTTTGDITISKSNPSLVLKKGASGQTNAVYGVNGTAARWGMFFGDNAAETGTGNAGSNFAIVRYNDGGAAIDNPLTIQRSTGDINFTGTVNAGGNLGITKAGPAIYMNRPAAVSDGGAPIYAQTAGKPRWMLRTQNDDVESGSNAGSNFDLHRYADDGSYLGRVLHVQRSTGVFTVHAGNFGPSTAQWTIAGGVGQSLIAAETINASQWVSAFKGNNLSSLYLLTAASGFPLYFCQSVSSNSVGNIAITSTATVFNTSSDGRRKPLRETFNGLDIVNALNPVRHNWNNEPNEWHYGVIAQEAVDVLPQMITRGDDDPDKLPGDDGFVAWSADYSQAVPVLLRAVQELSAKVTALEAALAEKQS